MDTTAWRELDDRCRVLVAEAAAPEERTYRALVASPHLEGRLIAWPAGGRLDLHDHGGASGALRVVGGELLEQFGTPGGALRTRRIGAGQGVSFGPSYVHDVANPGGPLATSVHLYSAAERSMAFHRHPAFARPA